MSAPCPLLKRILGLVVPHVMVDGIASRERKRRYHRLWLCLVILLSLVSTAPLIAVTTINYFQYRRAFQTELEQNVSTLTLNAERKLEDFFREHKAALVYVVHANGFDSLADQPSLQRIFDHLNASFGHYVDLGLIDSQGTQRTYVGPYQLLGRNYGEQPWFEEVKRRGAYVSEVFMGYRNTPHFVIAVRHDEPGGQYHILRATIDSQVLNEHIASLDLLPGADAFIVNRAGLLQTPTRWHGNILEPCRAEFDYAAAQQPDVRPARDNRGRPMMVGAAPIQDSPFVFVVVSNPGDPLGQWFRLRNRLLLFSSLSVLAVLIAVLYASTNMINRLRAADLEQAKYFDLVEYTSKMASIGRLAAGVAHEVNNPLAIINEKAGLLHDLAAMDDDFTERDRILQIVESIRNSVQRCSDITHRLLGFAKRVDVRIEPIELRPLLSEVLGFLGKGLEYDNIAVEFHEDTPTPAIHSDKGQLQQVMLNIINNAIAAMGRGGRLDIFLRTSDPGHVEVAIQDNGAGISEENLKHIFEPFFTTKKEYGTGLGLSITYGIVQKLGGRIAVESQLGHGTRFSVVLPIARTAATE